MEGFAAAAMIRLVRAGLEAQNLPLPPLPRSADARVPIDAKRQALGEIARRHGVPALLRIPEVLPRLPPGPALSALRLARDPDDLLDRWHRLERFAHSRHRIAVERSAPGDLVLVHRSLDPASGPTAQEDVLVFALITVLCEWSGATALEAGPIDADERWRRDGRWTEDLAGDVRRGWRIRHAPGRRRWPEEPAISDGGDPGVRLRDAVAADPAARWTVDRLAAAAGIGLRSLQRRLAAAGTTPQPAGGRDPACRGGGVPRRGRRRIGRDRLRLRFRRPAALQPGPFAATRASRRPPIGRRSPQGGNRLP